MKNFKTRKDSDRNAVGIDLPNVVNMVERERRDNRAKRVGRRASDRGGRETTFIVCIRKKVGNGQGKSFETKKNRVTEIGDGDVANEVTVGIDDRKSVDRVSEHDLESMKERKVVRNNVDHTFEGEALKL